MLEYLAAEECSPLLHTSGFPGVMGTCHTKLQLASLLHILYLLRGRASTPSIAQKVPKQQHNYGNRAAHQLRV